MQSPRPALMIGTILRDHLPGFYDLPPGDAAIAMASGTSNRLHILFRAVSTLLNNVGLISLVLFLAILALAGQTGIAHPLSIIIAVVGLVEILFYLAWFLPYRSRLQRPGPKPVSLSRTLRKQLFAKGLEHTKDIELYVRGWFQKAQLADIGVEGVKDWLLWALLDRAGDPGEDDAELNEYVEELEQKEELNIRKGAGDAEPIRLAFDPVKIRHRSLSFYSAVGLVDLITTTALLAKGFKYYRQPRSSFISTFPFRFKTLLFAFESAYPQLSYFYRPHKSADKRPIVLLHGAGLGLVSYLPWLFSLPPDVGVLAVEFLPISSRITAPLPPTHELVVGLAAILGNHLNKGSENDDFVLVAHSFGTLLVSPLLQRPDIASRVNSVIMADPLPFLAHLPDVAYNLTRRPPRPDHPSDWQLRYFATDPNIAHTIARRFCWHDFVLWTEQLHGRRTTVLLAGADGLVNPDAIASYIYYGDHNYTRQDRQEWRTTPARWSGQEELALFYLDEEEHGETFLSRRGRQALGKVVGTYCERSVAWTSRFAEEIKLGRMDSSASTVARPSEEGGGIGMARTSADAMPRMSEYGDAGGNDPMTRYSEASRLSRT